LNIISEKGNEINCIDFDYDGFNFATAGKDLNVRIYDRTLPFSPLYFIFKNKKFQKLS
jgi:WD40 repeat protein